MYELFIESSNNMSVFFALLYTFAVESRHFVILRVTLSYIVSFAPSLFNEKV